MADPDRPARRLVEEIDYRPTPIGPVSLRRRWVSAIDADVHEVMLGDEHLMSSLFTVGEIRLAELGLAWAQEDGLDVLVGGLGLGYTARAALDDPRVARVEVAEYLEPVIDWHRAGLTPLGAALSADPRCAFRHVDFFALMAAPDRQWDAILLDIDHAPDRWLAPSHADFYGEAALGRLRDALRPQGVFALWSDDRPDARFTARLAAVFAQTDAVEVEFPNPLSSETSRCTIYRARG
ncbi:MAG: spermidine synthase [Alphaproteobacteria bacterium]|nr:spermidine synthase [Alphaproteobacteria bacterium]MBU2418736.1 spermidine synthase [Alphaproteobacteria bacterium]